MIIRIKNLGVKKDPIWGTNDFIWCQMILFEVKRSFWGVRMILFGVRKNLFLLRLSITQLISIF